MSSVHTYGDGVLPSAELRALEREYHAAVSARPSPEGAQRAAMLIDALAGLWERFRRGQFASDNEDIDEYATPTLRFFLIPFYIGRLHAAVQGSTRPQHLESAVASLRAFADEMVRLGLAAREEPMPSAPGARRERAVADFRARRELEARLQRANDLTARDDLQRGFVGDAVDEEAEREVVMDLLRLSALEARAMARSAEEELPLARMRAEGVRPEVPKGPPPKMWVQRIEREEQMKKVFAPIERLMPKQLPPDDETIAKPDRPSPKLDASDDEEAEMARKEASRWDDYKDEHPPFSQM